ncbi:ornithine aminomutase subunit alpha [Selenihalanaerobacter shriftii]|uniref:D-ornithine 4,5-aminomutase S subunit n=1 Tax=Selenihalanaerobacter shriftii TaxID=142842 RepID=A0A1T4NCN2_9FIRM|nr:ornithine aminomutase subunit alpha [Selenihalanaerobacter shriftii]SJZ76994.1 D-ornithine 4,5-aminomutase S subunit [Selenihalanaerobacter shriftii]
MVEERKDDFQERRKKLTDLSDQELYEKFWDLAAEIVDPLVDLSKEYTSPAIERAVVLRMGFSSLEAKEIVNKIMEKDLLGKGAGHVILKLAQAKGLKIKEAGLAIADGKYDDELPGLFGGEVA